MHNARMLVCQWKLHEQKEWVITQVNGIWIFSPYFINKTCAWKNSPLMKQKFEQQVKVFWCWNLFMDFSGALLFSPQQVLCCAQQTEAHCFGDKASPGQITLFRPNLSSWHFVLPSFSREMVYIKLVKKKRFVIVGIVFLFLFFYCKFKSLLILH